MAKETGPNTEQLSAKDIQDAGLNYRPRRAPQNQQASATTVALAALIFAGVSLLAVIVFLTIVTLNAH